MFPIRAIFCERRAALWRNQSYLLLKSRRKYFGDYKPVDRKEKTDVDIVRALWQHIWPKDNTKVRLRVTLAVSLLIAGKV